MKPIFLTPQKNVTQQALKEKRDLLDQLAEENMEPLDLLKKVAQCHTQYGNLIEQAIEEFNYSHYHARSPQLEELERESTLKSAKVEVEIQQLQEKLIRTKSERESMKNRVKKTNSKLAKINGEIIQLQHLADSCSSNQEISDQESDSKENELRMESIISNKEPQLNEEVYHKLWEENTELQTRISDLKLKLHEVQALQIVAMKEYVQKKVKFPK